jgi:DNA-binding NarL/FixJ family response regulator
MDEAVEHYRSAVEWARRSCQLPSEMWASYELGRALLGRGAPGDRAEAAGVLQKALELARSKDMKLLVRTIEHVLSPEARSLPAGLTAREAEALRLLASGKTDKEIAFELRITVRTASNHVSNILRKIGAGNRTEAARYAVSHGLAG